MNGKIQRKVKKDPKTMKKYNISCNVDQSALLMLQVAMLYLHEKKGYGKKRLWDFVKGCADILNTISNEDMDSNII